MWLKYRSNLGLFFSVLISFSIFVVAAGALPLQIRCPIQSLYQLGDSISDTGNVVRLFSIAPSSRRPYGETFPGYPTGRWSDGRLIIDYIAMALGLPLLNPYLAKNASFDNGVNFAAAEEVIKAGASQVIVPGNFPLGCFPFYLFYAASDDPTAYDDMGCLKSVNKLTTFENTGLQGALESLRKEFPNAIILYADYYNAFQSLLREAPTLGQC
ncbi:hypothetical protein DH2020_043428 [Rehmannia glutinosa]|uniref:GDSL esterase/lipase n=1 Tax=Rehmannia glutinosa TaxID=99300 RepID=A0ABR0UJL5_REHGL